MGQTGGGRHPNDRRPSTTRCISHAKGDSSAGQFAMVATVHKLNLFVDIQAALAALAKGALRGSLAFFLEYSLGATAVQRLIAMWTEEGNRQL